MKVLLPAQQRMLEAQIERGPDTLCEFIWACWPEICEMARRRHSDGYAVFGDAMYHWPPAVRRKNMLEEAADLLVYMSGEG